MKIAFYSAHTYDKDSMMEAAKMANVHDELEFFKHSLSSSTANLAKGCDIVVIFVNDCANETVLHKLHENGVHAVLLRCAGYDMIDLKVAKELNILVLRVPAYSPYAVAEHATALMLALNRQIPRAYNRTREFNFSLSGLLGFDLHGKTVGVMGTGQIGAIFAKICNGFGCKLLAYDVRKNSDLEKLDVKYVSKEELFKQSDIISLHCPLFDSTRHVINEESISQMKKGVMIINTSRGGLIDTKAVIKGLKRGQIGSIAIDVFEGENGIFYQDHSSECFGNDVLSRLVTFPNVIVTGHQAYFTKEALQKIAETTMENIQAVVTGSESNNIVE